MKNMFMNISLRGRVAYVILCFEEYVRDKYSVELMRPVIEKMWAMVSEPYIDVKAMEFMEIIPEYLFEFDNYEEAEFDYLTKTDYNCFVHILNKDDEKLNSIMNDAFQIIWEYAYCDITDHGSQNYHYIMDVQEIMKSSSLALPSLQKVSFSSFNESDGWGELIDPKGLSTVL